MIFSTTEVALKGLGGVFAPMQITVERVLIGALFLLPFALRSLRRNAIRLTRSDWSYFGYKERGFVFCALPADCGVRGCGKTAEGGRDADLYDRRRLGAGAGLDAGDRGRLRAEGN